MLNLLMVKVVNIASARELKNLFSGIGEGAGSEVITKNLIYCDEINAGGVRTIHTKMYNKEDAMMRIMFKIIIRM